MSRNATFNNISAIVWWSVLLVEETTDLPQITDKLYHIMLNDVYLNKIFCLEVLKEYVAN
jgi:hypothetical protein